MIKSVKANYAFLDEMQDQWKLEISNCGFWIADCGFMRIRKGNLSIADFELRIYENLEGANRIDRALSKNKAQND